jgi:two-component system nitrogen regulation sensor histidine kinase NtrY
MVPDKEKKKRKKRLLIAALVLFVIVLISIEYFVQKFPNLTHIDITNTIVLTAILEINIILIFIILLVLGRNITKLYIERRKKLLGSKFKTKLVTAFIGLALIPSILLFIFASDIILKSIDRWFSTPVSRIADHSFKIADSYYDQLEERALEFAQDLSKAIVENNLINKKYWLESYFAKRKLDEGNLDVINIYEKDTELITPIINPNIPLNYYNDVPKSYLNKGLSGEDFVLREPIGKGMMIRGGTPIYSGDQVIGVAITGFYVNPEVATLAGRIKSFHENFQQSKIQKGLIKLTFVMLFLMITLLVLFSAAWLGLYLSKGITVPVQKLAEGTREISAGNLDYKIEATAGDELGILIQSFNEMTYELKQSKDKLEQSNISLKKTSSELDQRRRYMEKVLQNITTGIIALDKRGKISSINRAALTLLHMNGENYEGMKYNSALVSEEFKPINELIKKAKGKRDYFTKKELNLPINHTLLTLAVNVATLKDKSNKYMGMIIMLDDLTQFIRAQKVAAWREVAKKIAHEIKNPLTPIQLSAERVRKKFKNNEFTDEKVIDECIKTIVQEVNAIKNIVNEFSRFARMPETKLLESDINSVIDNTLLLYQDCKPHIIIIKKLSNKIPKLKIDPDKIKRALINLIDNAIEAIKDKGQITISSRFVPENNSIQITISDTGQGIKPEDKSKLFLPNFSTKSKGAGLGLTIVDQIISDHHGSIKVEDNIPQGTNFIIEIPA